MSPEANAYLDKLDAPVEKIARAIAQQIQDVGPELKLGLAWGFPCWTGQERIFSIIGHKNRCNLQLWSGARLLEQFPNRIEGTGKQLRHVKVTSISEIDEELKNLMIAAIALDRFDPEKVR